MNIVLQQYGSSCYNVWEDVKLANRANHIAGLSGLYRAHKYHKRIYDKEFRYCSWTYKDLYLVKEVYGGFVKAIQKGMY